MIPTAEYNLKHNIFSNMTENLFSGIYLTYQQKLPNLIVKLKKLTILKILKFPMISLSKFSLQHLVISWNTIFLQDMTKNAFLSIPKKPQNIFLGFRNQKY